MLKKRFKYLFFNKIGIKILLVSLVMSLTVIVNSYFVVIRSLDVQELSHKEVYSSILYLNEIWEIMESLDHQKIAIECYMLKNKDADKAKADYFKEKKRMDEIFSSYYQHSCPHIRPLLKEMQKKIYNYSQKVEQIFSLRENNVSDLLLKNKINEVNKLEEDIHNNYLQKIIVHIQDNHIKPTEKHILDLGNIIIKNILIASIMVVFLSFFLGVFVTSSVAKPIQVLNQAVKRISQGNFDLKIDIKSKDEIGDLARSFENMANKLKSAREEIKAYNKRLENEVLEKTKKLTHTLNILEKDKKELEKQKLATLNILEDVSESEKKLKSLNANLEKRRFELEALKSLNEELTQVSDLENLLNVVNKYLWEILDCGVCSFLVYDKLSDSILVKSYLRKPIPPKTLNVIHKELFSYAKGKLKSKKGIKKENAKILVQGKVDSKKHEFPVASFVLPLIAGHNFLGAVHISFFNITSSHKEEQALTQAIIASASVALDRLQTLILTQHSRTESLINSLFNGVIMFDSERKIVFINPAAIKFLKLKGRPDTLDEVLKFFPDKSISILANKALKKDKTSFLGDLPIESRYYELHIVPVKDFTEKVVGAAFIMHDITQRKQIETMKTEFVSVASHQLRTPLTAIKLFTDMLIRGEVGKLNREQKKYLDNIHQSTERMVRLVNDLLNVTRIESGRLMVNPQPIDLEKFIEDIITEVKPLAGSKKIKIIFKKPRPKLPEINLDQNLIRQVIHNLIVNAIRYSSPQNGQVKISLERKGKKYYLITIKDNGIGIPAKARDRIFEKFFRADNAVKRVTEGTGLGLYVSKMIVESSGGKIWFESKNGRGTQFFVTLPTKGMKPKKGERGLAIS